MLVVVGHFLTDTVRPGLSTLAVDLYFVLSIRLMAEILIVRQVPVRTFLACRFSSVYPALFVFVILTAVVFKGTCRQNGAGAVVSALIFMADYGMIHGHTIALLVHLWSLCVEEHSDLLPAFIAAVMVREQRGAAIILLALSIATTDFAFADFKAWLESEPIRPVGL